MPRVQSVRACGREPLRSRRDLFPKQVLPSAASNLRGVVLAAKLSHQRDASYLGGGPLNRQPASYVGVGAWSDFCMSVLFSPWEIALKIELEDVGRETQNGDQETGETKCGARPA